MPTLQQAALFKTPQIRQRRYTRQRCKDMIFDAASAAFYKRSDHPEQIAAGTSLRKCIDLHCRSCIFDSEAPGRWRQQVDACGIIHCALYAVRAKSTPNTSPKAGKDPQKGTFTGIAGVEATPLQTPLKRHRKPPLTVHSSGHDKRLAFLFLKVLCKTISPVCTASYQFSIQE